MTTFIYAFMFFLLIFFAGAWLGRVDEGEAEECNQCETEECMPDCEHHEWRTG